MKKITAEIFVLKDCVGKLINDIDTDMIFHNKYLSIVDINLMGQYALDNLEGYKDFSKKVKAGMIVVAGENFGADIAEASSVLTPQTAKPLLLEEIVIVVTLVNAEEKVMTL